MRLAAMTKTCPVAAWIADDTGLPKKGTHSVGVARQYCGQTGKQDNCQVAVSQLRQQARIPNDIVFQTKPEIALAQIRQAIADGIPQATVLADPAYGNDTGFREALAGLELSYVLGIDCRVHIPILQSYPCLTSYSRFFCAHASRLTL